MNGNPILLWLSTRKAFIEILLTTLVATGAILNYFKTPGSTEALMITMSLLSGYYFLSAYFITDLQGLPGIIATKVIGIASAICIVGLLYAILHLVGAAQMLIIGILSLGGASLFVGYSAIKAWKASMLPLIIRTALLLSICIPALMKLLEGQPS